jgi:hypothetical protein
MAVPTEIPRAVVIRDPDPAPTRRPLLLAAVIVALALALVARMVATEARGAGQVVTAPAK